MSDSTLMNFEEVSRSDVLRDAISTYDKKIHRAKASRWAYVIAGIAVATILISGAPVIAAVVVIASLVLAVISGKPAKNKLRSTALSAFASQIGFDYIANGDGPLWEEASKQFFKNWGRVRCAEMFRRMNPAGLPIAAYRATTWEEADGGETSMPSIIFNGIVYVLPRSNPGTGIVVIAPRGHKNIEARKLPAIRPTELPAVDRFDVYSTAKSDAQRFLENGRFVEATAQLSRAQRVLIYANPQAILVAVEFASEPHSDVKLASPGEDLVRREFARFSETMANLKRLETAFM